MTTRRPLPRRAYLNRCGAVMIAGVVSSAAGFIGAMSSTSATFVGAGMLVATAGALVALGAFLYSLEA